MFPTPDVILADFNTRINALFMPQQHQITAISPQALFITSERTSHSFPTIPVTISTPNDTYEVEALLDSGATSLYISRDFVKTHNIPTRRLAYPTPVWNADDTRNTNMITHQAKLTSHIQGHSSTEWFLVTNIGTKEVIIGMLWLRSHNPQINWRTGQISFTRCPWSCSKTSKLQHLQSNLERASVITNYPSSEAIAAVHHATEWEIEALKSKKVLTIEDIKTGPFSDYLDVFEEKNYQALPPHRIWDHHIDLVQDWEAKKWKPRIYPLSYTEQKELDQFLEENLKNGRIRPSESPLASPVFFINKKDGKKRMVIDYRKLNDLTIKNVYPLPRIDELIQKWKGCKHFVALDVRSGYYNIRMKEGDEWKTAFITNRGLFESLVMTFGLCNAPSTFQTMMDAIFIVYIRRGDTNCFIDDVGIGIKSDPTGQLTDEEFAIKVTKEILEVFRKHNLSLKPEKCLFLQKEIPYLGYIISGEGIRPDPVKLSGIKDWPVPKSVSETRSYLGMVGYYRRFVKDFSKIARPLNDLLRKEATWQWTQEQQDAFQALKDHLLSDAFLLHPDNEKPFVLETDASGFAWGAMLSQEDDTGKMRPVSCCSKGFADAETRYDTHDRELLAIIRSLEANRHWLMGTKYPVTILTDHNNLNYFKDKQFLSKRQTRWMEFLSNFNFELAYRPGKKNQVADLLSRRVDHEVDVPDEAKILLPPSSIVKEQRIASIAHPDSGFPNLEKELYASQAQDPIILKFNMTREGDDTTIPEGWGKRNDLWNYHGKIYIPPEFRQTIFRQLHSSPSASHPGRDATTYNIQKDFYWPRMRQDVHEWVKNCDICQRMKIRPKKPSGHLKPIDVNPGLWKVVTSDLITGLPLCKGYDAIWTATDKGGKMKHIAATTSTLDSKGLYHLYLEHVWKLHGTQDKLICDRGPQYASQYSRETSHALGIQLALSTAYHPQTDGQSERTNQEVEQALRTIVSFHQDDWVDWLPVIEFALNNRFHKALGTTPFYANYGYHPQIGSLPRITSPIESVEDFVTHLHEVQKDTGKALEQAAEDMKRFYDRNRGKTPDFQVGQKVLLDTADLSLNRPSRKLSEKRTGPFEIISKVGTHAYRLKLPLNWKNVHPVFHVSKLDPYHEDPNHPNHPTPPPDVIGEELEWEVEKILDSKFQGGRLLFFVKWLGYPDSDASWEDEINLENSPDIIAEFYKTHPSAPRRLPDGEQTGTSLTKKKRRGRKRIGCLDHKPLKVQTNVSQWPEKGAV